MIPWFSKHTLIFDQDNKGGKLTHKAIAEDNKAKDSREERGKKAKEAREARACVVV